MLLCTALTHSCMRRSESACRRQDLDQGNGEQGGSKPWESSGRMGRLTFSECVAGASHMEIPLYQLVNTLLDTPLCPILSPQVDHNRLTSGAAGGPPDPCQPVRLRHTGHHPWALYSLAGGHDLQSRTVFLSQDRASLCRRRRSSTTTVTGSWLGEGRCQVTTAGLGHSWGPVPRPSHLVPLLIDQLVALNSEPASGRGNGNNVHDVGVWLRRGTQEECGALSFTESH